MPRSRLLAATAVGAAALMALAGCASSSGSSGGGGGSDSAKVAILTSKTGPLAEYGQEYINGFKAGLDYATQGTGKVDGRTIDVTYADDQGKPETAVSQFKDLVGKGYQVIGGTADSGIALQLAPLAEQNKVLYVSGPAAVDSLTGINDYTFRSGRQTYQDVATAGASVGDVQGKKIVVFAQDYAFGQANEAAVKSVLGAQGADVSSIMVPLSATDFTPFALKAKQAGADLLFVAWAGDTTGAMWQALDQQGVLGSTTVVTGLATTASYQIYGPASSKIDFLSYYFSGAPDNDVNAAMVDALQKQGAQADLFSPDGFVAAQMMVHALQSGDDVDGMIKSLEGWTFNAPKGQETVRASDHAMLQPMFLAKLTKKDGQWAPELVKTLPADQVAPPEAGS
ncbi:substrate-binding domain-containing protein [Nocardioides panaciterrulae]|uniref:Branched-chain amino acid transport system substrate-binding protein n=1 Tax=Nocardioides panaciterrulae TaxID=661492 RepID=A0A7Y9E4Y3_9ACTN|nr:substrate-binding domain-containing protein [Nocardioides panaciterrulae]NYD41336.1 branched-chain amino acid transport system substrate-binding protein [Nocardioides panaciterrulae]